MRLRDDSAKWLLFSTFCFLYIYFFQGGGWNQNAHFDTVRALVETGSPEITPYAANTGDVSRVGERVFSNKPPGLAFAGAPLYLLLFLAERALGADIRDPMLVTANAHLTTFFVSGLPAAVLVILLYVAFRRERVEIRDAALLAAAFGAGTLLLPYSGMMMSHNLVALCLFGAWLLAASGTPSRGAIAFGGALLGLGILTDYLVAPIAAGASALVAARARNWHAPALFLCGSTVAILLLSAYNLLTFGRLLTTSYANQSGLFTSSGLLFGNLDWPQWERLWWLSVHPFRGLFYCCPVLLLGVVGIVRFAGQRTLRGQRLLPLFVCIYFLLFNLTFNGWTGGWGIGPRYLIPALPFLFLYGPWVWQRARVLGASLALLSAAIMLTVTSVSAMIPAPNSGPPPQANPVAFAFNKVAQGRVAISTQSVLEGGSRPTTPAADFWDAYNLGELLGLRGFVSIVPALAVLVAFVLTVWLSAPASTAPTHGPNLSNY